MFTFFLLLLRFRHSFVGKVELVDFGATREYSQKFMDNWLRLLQAAADEDREACVHWSLQVGYLTGDENDVSTEYALTR